MTERRREVTVAERLFRNIDAVLGDDPGPSGEPSRHQFLSGELPAIRETFATRWDDLPLVGSDPDFRFLMVAGRLVFAITVYGRLLPSGRIELFRCEIQTRWPVDPDNAPDDEQE